MKRFCSVFILLIFVVCMAVLLYILTSPLNLLEIFLIALGVLCILWLITKLDDQIHLYRIRRQHREMALRREYYEMPLRRRRTF
jgi:hypothetical protein